MWCWLARSQAKRDGDVDWDMFVRVLQSRGDLTEGEAAGKIQCAWRMFAAKRYVENIRLERALVAESKASKKRGKTSGKGGKKASKKKGSRQP